MIDETILHSSLLSFFVFVFFRGSRLKMTHPFRHFVVSLRDIIVGEGNTTHNIAAETG